MSLILIDKPTVRGVGSTKAKIALVGEAPGAEEMKKGVPFSGAAGGVLEQCMHAAELIRSDCYMTNVIKERPANNDITPFYGKKGFTQLAEPYLQELYDELAELAPRIVVAIGNTATAALTNVSSVLKYRGYVFDGKNGLAVIPTIHPAAALRGNYLYRYLISRDLKKAKLLAKYPKIIRPLRELIVDFGSVDEAIEWIILMSSQPRISIDIEVMNYGISLLGISDSPHRAISIPMADNYWGSARDEAVLWRAIDNLLQTDNIKIFQNGIFDISFLSYECGFQVRGTIEDTMIAHHILYPDFKKGLGFLGSLYCGTQEYWKDMADFDDIKEES